MGLRKTAVALAFITMAIFGSATRTKAQDVGLAIGAVPEAVTLQDLEGNDADLSRYVGKKPVLIEFWATWCPLCAQLEPKLHAAKKRHGDKLDVLVIAVGVNQTPRSITRHMQSHQMPGPVLFDARGRATRAFMAPSTSYIVALDASGKVVYTGVGADQDIAAAALKAVGGKQDD